MSEDRYGPTDAEVQRAIKIGKYVARHWPQVPDADVVSALYEWLMVNERYVLQYRAEGTHGRNKLNKALQNHATRFCSVEHRASAAGLAANDEPVYTLDEVRAGLEVVCGQPDWAVQGESGNMNPDILALLADVSSALYSLPKRQRDLLAMRFGMGLSYATMAGLLDVEVKSARERCGRALRKVESRMRGEGASWGRSPGLASRSADGFTEAR